MVPTLLGLADRQRQHEYLYWEFHERDGKQAVRWGKWKAVRINWHKKPGNPLELYDLEQDIGENFNVADKHPDIVAVFENYLKTARTEAPNRPVEKVSSPKIEKPKNKTGQANK
jgi:arylsulfatase A-like enzyme